MNENNQQQNWREISKEHKQKSPGIDNPQFMTTCSRKETL